MKQRSEDRKSRLGKGCCPVHGLWMGQIDRWYEQKHGKPFTYVGCPRRACKIRAKAYDIDGPWELEPEFLALLDDSVDDPSYLEPDSLPAKKKKSLIKFKQAVWQKTLGRCYFCGNLITYSQMTIDHFVPEAADGSDDITNLVPSCKSCNSTKGTKSIEEFRFYVEQRGFLLLNGVSFTREQIAYLSRVGVELDISPHTFWFEDNNA